MSSKSNIRLFVSDRLASQAVFALSEPQSHYLVNVMKVKIGEKISVFNPDDGEFCAEIVNISKKSVSLLILSQNRPCHPVPDVWLLFAPLKKDKTDFVIQKATELGCAKIIPVVTKFCITDKTRTERFKAQAIEAAEQSKRIDIPTIEEATPLVKLLSRWDKNRILFFMDESGGGNSVFSVFSDAKKQNISSVAILVGPEGGFSDDELNMLRGLSFAKPVSLGPRILRAETAVAAALSCWQAISGDWA